MTGLKPFILYEMSPELTMSTYCSRRSSGRCLCPTSSGMRHAKVYVVVTSVKFLKRVQSVCCRVEIEEWGNNFKAEF